MTERERLVNLILDFAEDEPHYDGNRIEEDIADFLLENGFRFSEPKKDNSWIMQRFMRKE